MVEHRALANVMGWMGEAWPLGPGDVVLQKTPVSFDASARELFPPLLAGARVGIARPGGARAPAGGGAAEAPVGLRRLGARALPAAAGGRADGDRAPGRAPRSRVPGRDD